MQFFTADAEPASSVDAKYDREREQLLTLLGSPSGPGVKASLYRLATAFILSPSQLPLPWLPSLLRGWGAPKEQPFPIAILPPALAFSRTAVTSAPAF